MMAPRHQAKSQFKSPHFGVPHDNPKAKSDQWEKAIEDFFKKILKTIKIWKN